MTVAKAKRRDVWFYLTIGVIALYALFLLYPLVSMLSQSVYTKEGGFSLDFFRKFFSKKYYFSAIFNSMKVTLAVTVACALVATPLAYLMATVRIRGKRAIEILLLVSSLSPPFIGAYSWILLLGRNGYITNFLQSIFGITFPDIYGFGGIMLVLTVQMTPLMYIYVSGALKNLDSSLLEAAENLGCSGIGKIFKVVLPLVLPTVLASSLLIFMRALADFGTPMLIGEGYRTVPVLIYNEFISEMGGDEGFAAAISVLVVLFTTAVFLLQKFIVNKKSFSMSSLRPLTPKKAGPVKTVLSHAFVYIYLLIALLPQICVISTSFRNTNGRIFVEGLSLNSYREAFTKVGNAIVNTFSFSLIALLIIVVLASIIAYVTVRRRSALTSFLDVVTMFPYIVPGSILGIALLSAFSRRPILLSGTAAIMIISYVVRRIPYTIRSSAAILNRVSISTEEAAISLGASKLGTFARVTFPSILSGVFSGMILSWTSMITELSTSILLYNNNTKTMTVAIYTEVLRGNYGVAGALSSLLTLITIVSLALFFKFSGKKDLEM